MDPISAPLLAALVAAVEKKFTGAMAQWFGDAVKERAARLQALFSERDAEKLAQAAVNEVLAEAAAYPPGKALLVRPLGTPVGVVGIWGPHGTLRLNVLWVNRADFPLYVRDVRVTAKVGGRQNEWDAVLGDEFRLGPRGDVERVLELEPRHEVPTIERGTNCDVSITALVGGPWEGRAQRTQDLVSTTGIWLPAVGLEPASNLLTEVADIDLAIEHFVTELEAKIRAARTTRVLHERVSYVDLDRKLGLRHGASKERLEAVVKRMGQHVQLGPRVALVRVRGALQGISHGGILIGGDGY